MGNICNGATRQGAPDCLASYDGQDIHCKPRPADGWSACYRKECLEGTKYDLGDDQHKRELAGIADCKAQGYEGWVGGDGWQEHKAWENCGDFHFAFKCKGTKGASDDADTSADGTCKANAIFANNIVAKTTCDLYNTGGGKFQAAGAQVGCTMDGFCTWTSDPDPDKAGDKEEPPTDARSSLMSPGTLITVASMVGFYFMSSGKKKSGAAEDPLAALIAKQNAAVSPQPSSPPETTAAVPPSAPAQNSYLDANPYDFDMEEPPENDDNSTLMLVVVLVAVVLGAVALHRDAVLKALSQTDDDKKDKK